MLLLTRKRLDFKRDAEYITKSTDYLLLGSKSCWNLAALAEGLAFWTDYLIYEKFLHIKV